MTKEDFDPLAFTTAVNTLAVAIAQNLSEDELALLTAVLVQLTGTLTTITVQQTLYGSRRMARPRKVWPSLCCIVCDIKLLYRQSLFPK